MNDTKFTPGPWAIENHFGEAEVVSCNERDAEEKELGVIYVIAGRIGGRVHGEHKYDDFSEVEANRSLIATAPGLYADLAVAAALLRKYETLHRAKKTAESTAKAEVNAELAERFELTLAKARGES